MRVDICCSSACNVRENIINRWVKFHFISKMGSRKNCRSDLKSKISAFQQESRGKLKCLFLVMIEETQIIFQLVYKLARNPRKKLRSSSDQKQIVCNIGCNCLLRLLYWGYYN